MYRSKPETEEHIRHLNDGIKLISSEILSRGPVHDASKLEPPEIEYFDKYTPLLKTLKYGTQEYTDSLAALKPALDHHYANNRHHPEFHAEDAQRQGTDQVSCMNLVDIIEMFCDWNAASKRTKDGDFGKSIEISCERFKISDQLRQIFRNTRRDFFVEDSELPTR